MQNSFIRNIFYLFGKEIKLTLLLVFAAFGVKAQQPNLYQSDFKPIHFGFNVCVNSSGMQLNRSRYFYNIDSLKSLRAQGFPGLGLGAITNFRAGKFLDVRAIFPQLVFTQRNLVYDFYGTTQKQTVVKVESIYLQASLLLKYKSERHRNTRFYVIGGAYLSHDFGSTVDQSRSNTKAVVSLIPDVYGYEAGFGFDFYYPYFKFSPELKLSNAMTNALYKDPYIYSQSINSIFPKMLTLTFNFESGK